MSKRMQKGKQIISGLLALVLLLGCMPSLTPMAKAATGLSLTAGNRHTAVNGGDYSLPAGNVTNWSFNVPSGVAATLTVSGATTIDNRTAGGGSPISVQPGGTLNLVVNGTLTVYGQHAADGELGTPGYSGALTRAASAGVNVPSGATIKFFGAGKVNAYGGDAGNGGDTDDINDAISSGGGGGGGAGVGGNGGGGGGAGFNNGLHATAGQDAGSIYFLNTVRVDAFGGGGGSGGSDNHSDGAGGGGYPGAGVGGGGGGGGAAYEFFGGGGFSGGGVYYLVIGAVNGLASKTPKAGGAVYYLPGSGYFEEGIIGNHNRVMDFNPGGVGGTGAYNKNNGNYKGVGDGGTGGRGGAVYKAPTSAVNAKNGSATTTAANLYGTNTTPIYAQQGYNLTTARAGGAATKAQVQSAAYKNIPTLAYGLGMGSGAGSTEYSNGTYVANAAVPVAPVVSAKATAGTPKSIDVSWTAPTSSLPITGYNVFRSATANGTYTLVTTTAAGATSFVETGLANNTTYYYKVSAVNAAGESAQSTPAASGTTHNIPGGITLKNPVPSSDTTIVVGGALKTC